MKKFYQHKVAYTDISKNFFFIVCDEHFEVVNLNQTASANYNQWVQADMEQQGTKQHGATDKTHSIFPMQIINFTLTPDLKFCLTRTKTNEISMIRLRSMVEITRLPLLKHFSSMVSSEKYLSFRIDGRLLSFLIIDQDINKNNPSQQSIQYA